MENIPLSSAHRVINVRPSFRTQLSDLPSAIPSPPESLLDPDEAPRGMLGVVDIQNSRDWSRNDHNHHRPHSPPEKWPESWLTPIDVLPHDEKRARLHSPTRSPTTDHRSYPHVHTNGHSSALEVPSSYLSPTPPISPKFPIRPLPSSPLNLITDVYPSAARIFAPAKAFWPGMTKSQPFWLALYFVFNLSLTLYNKGVLVKFPFPYTLTALHALCGSIGGYVLLENGYYVPARLTQRENYTLAAFSILYTINITVSNLSLQLVTVPFHQVVRASTPLFTILLSVLILRTRINRRKLATLLPVMAGVGFATYGDYYFTAWGLFLTLLGTFLASLKTVITNMIQNPAVGSRGLKLHPLDLLLRMSPLAFIQCVIYGWMSGELERVRRFGALEMTWGRGLALAVNGIIAFILNIVSFTANKKSGPLTMTVAANVKQVLTILLAVMIFNLTITPVNGIGILLTVSGGAWYAFLEFNEKRRLAGVSTFTRRRA